MLEAQKKNYLMTQHLRWGGVLPAFLSARTLCPEEHRRHHHHIVRVHGAVITVILIIKVIKITIIITIICHVNLTFPTSARHNSRQT